MLSTLGAPFAWLQEAQETLKAKNKTLTHVNAEAINKSKKALVKAITCRPEKIAPPCQVIFSVLAWRWNINFCARWRRTSASWNVSAKKTSDYVQAVLKLSDPIALHYQIEIWLCHSLRSLWHLRNGISLLHQKNWKRRKGSLPERLWMGVVAVHIHYWWTQRRSNCCAVKAYCSTF